MANSGRLEIEIGADVSGLEQGIQDAERQLRTLESRRDARVRIGADTSELDRRISGVNTRLNELRTSAAGAQTAMRGMTGQVGNGSNALMQFSRIAQDAPFGIIGIGNNLTATAEAFGHLRNQTGSAGGALRAMASSLMGTGGILLGVSLLTTGFTLLAQSGLSVGDVIDKITGNFDEFGQAIKKASEEAVKSTSGEIFEIKSLVAIAQDENKARKERLAAVEALQNQYPGYFANLSKEQILTQNLTGVVNELARALIAKEAAQNVKKSAAPLLLQLYTLNGLYIKQRAALTEQNAVVRDAIDVYGEQSQTAKEAIATQNGLYNQMEKTRGEIYKSTEGLKAYERIMNTLNSSASKLLIKSPPKTQAPKAPKAPKINPNAGNEFTPFLNPFESSIIPPIELTFTDPTEGFLAFNAKVLAGMTTTELMWQDFGIRLSDTIESGTENALIGFGESLGNALANGTNIVQSIGQSLVSSLGQMISAVGKEMVKMGVLAQAYAAVVKWMQKAFTNPYALAAAGVALIVIGSAISGSASRVGSGGSGSTSTSSGSNANNSSRVSGGFSGGGGFGGGTVVFEIAGTSLIGVLNNTQARNLRIGGTN